MSPSPRNSISTPVHNTSVAPVEHAPTESATAQPQQQDAKTAAVRYADTLPPLAREAECDDVAAAMRTVDAVRHRVHAIMGNVYLQRGEVARALTEYETAVRMGGPRDEEAYASLAGSLPDKHPLALRAAVLARQGERLCIMADGACDRGDFETAVEMWKLGRECGGVLSKDRLEMVSAYAQSSGNVELFAEARLLLGMPVSAAEYRACADKLMGYLTRKKDFWATAMLDMLVDGYIRAGAVDRLRDVLEIIARQCGNRVHSVPPALFERITTQITEAVDPPPVEQLSLIARQCADRGIDGTPLVKHICLLIARAAA